MRTHQSHPGASSSLFGWGLALGLMTALWALGSAACAAQSTERSQIALSAVPTEDGSWSTPQDGDASPGAGAGIRAIVRAYETAAISAEVNARITYVPVREGDLFRRGDVLVEFDCRRKEAERDAAWASMKELESAYASQLKLLEYQSAGTLAVEQALHQLEKAKAQLRLNEVEVESCRIVAPFDGVVTEKIAQLYEIAQPNQPLIRIINPAKTELVMMVPSAWLAKVGSAAFPVRIDETGKVYEAKVVQSTGLIDPVSQTARVIAELVAPSADVMPGMSGTAVFSPEWGGP